jgi:hypothetical protein
MFSISISLFNNFPGSQARQSEHQDGKGTLKLVEVFELGLGQSFFQEPWERQSRQLNHHDENWHEQEHQHRSPVEKMFPWFFLHGISAAHMATELNFPIPLPPALPYPALNQ